MPVSININGKEIDIHQFRNDWALALMNQGIIIKLSISRWRAMASLGRDDLGLKFSNDEGLEFMKKYITLGSEKLLPPRIIREIEEIETRARYNLINHSFDTVWGKFVPYSAFDSWERENAIIKDNFFEAARVIGERYDQIIQTVKEEYRKLAKDVWARLYQNNNPTESFIENFVSNIVSKIPNRNNMVASFKYDTMYFIVPMPSIIEESISKARDIQRERENKEIENNIQNDTKRRISEEYFKRKQELIDGFLESTVASLRTYIGELCEGVLVSIQQNSSYNDVRKNNLNKIKVMIKKVKLLNFYNDDEISQILSGLEEEVNKFKGARNKDVIVEKLQKIVEIGKNDFLPKNFNPTIGFLDV